MKNKKIYLLVGVIALGVLGWYFLKPPPLPVVKGLSSSELHQIRWEINAPYLFRDLSWEGLKKFPVDLLSWPSKNKKIVEFKKNDDGTVFVFIGEKDGDGFFYVLRQENGRWQSYTVGEWSGS